MGIFSMQGRIFARRRTMLLKDFLQKDYRQLRDVSAATITTYSAAVRSLEKHLQRDATLDDLTPTAINEWLTALLECTSRETAYSYRRYVLALWRGAEELELLKLGPRRIKPIRRPARVVEGFSAADMQKLLAATKGMRRWLWWRVFLQIAWFSGLRLSDVLSIERKWIWPGENGGGILSVVQQKTGQTISKKLPPELMREIDELVEPGQRLIVPLWCRREAFFRSFKRLTKRAGLPPGTTKWIRRGSASEIERLASGAGPIHLGHSRGSGSQIFNQSYKVDRIVQPEIPLPPPICG